MVQEVSKSFLRRSADYRFATRWFVGDGIDIGSGDDPLAKFAPLLPLVRSIRSWDRSDGDAMQMQDIESDAFDFVHSSHCLEHLDDPASALQNWIRICRPGGHLIITVPDEDLYEQGVFPSTFNREHRWTFTIGKSQSWSSRSINVIELLGRFVREIAIIKIELLDWGFLYDQPRQDQTLGATAESAIEIVLRKHKEIKISTENAAERVDASNEKVEDEGLRSAVSRDTKVTGNIKNILLRRQGAMGDLIMTTPVAARLRHLYGSDAVINVETLQLGVYINNPHINGVNVSEPPGGYDRIIDLNWVYENHPRVHVIDAYMIEAFGDSNWPEKQVLMYKAAIPELSALPWERVVAIHAARSALSRTFPYAFWEAVIDGLLADGLTPVTLGARDDLSWPDKVGVIDLTHRLSIQQVASVIDKSACFICGDTGLMQVAGSTMTPIVGIYTSVRPEYRIPWRNGELGWRVTALVPDLDCSGCAADEPLPVTALTCRRGDYACVGTNMVAPAAVLDAVRQHIAPEQRA